jgi:hypothetical protein
MAAERNGGDTWVEHDHIPKNAEGTPVFFILPDGIKARYERWLGSSKRTWLATGDPGALRKAVFDVKLHRQTMPDWLFDAIVTILTDMRSADDVKRAQSAFLHSQRYQAVRDAVAFDAAAGSTLSIDEASARVAKAFKRELGKAAAVKRSYFKVKKALQQGRGAAFNLIHIPKGLSR